MSLVDPQFESTVISLLKGIYDNIGSGLPYTFIQGIFKQSPDDDSVSWQELYNNTGYTFSVLGLTPGVVRFQLDEYTGDTRKVCVFIGPSVSYRDIISTDATYLTTDPYRYYVYSVRTSDNSFGPAAFIDYVSFEIRIYPEV